MNIRTVYYFEIFRRSAAEGRADVVLNNFFEVDEARGTGRAEYFIRMEREAFRAQNRYSSEAGSRPTPDYYVVKHTFNHLNTTTQQA